MKLSRIEQRKLTDARLFLRNALTLVDHFSARANDTSVKREILETIAADTCSAIDALDDLLNTSSASLALHVTKRIPRSVK